MNKNILKQIILAIIMLYPLILIGQNSVKWEEIFTTPDLPADWKAIDKDNSGDSLSLFSTVSIENGTTIAPQGGSYFWYGSYANANLAGEIDEWLISPQISVVYAGDSLYFWAGANDVGFDDSLRVFVSTSGNMKSDFKHLLGYFKVDGPVGTWNKYAFDLSAFDSLDIYFAVNYYIKNGGSGGRNSDHLWIDHFLISGDPSKINQPPLSFNLINPVNQSWLHPVADSTIYFRWTASYDADNDNLIYNFKILDVFPTIKAEIVTDTTFAFDWINVINYLSVFRWTVSVTDGKSTFFCPDTFLFVTPPIENLPPFEFSLVQPKNQETVSLTDSTAFSWRPAFDPNQENLFYELQISGNGQDTLFTEITDTLLTLFCGSFLEENNVYSWTVFANDSVYLTQSRETWEIRTQGATNINNILVHQPEHLILKQNYPNPFNPITTIEYVTIQKSTVSLHIYDLLGQKVRSLVDAQQNAGRYTVQWNGRDEYGELLPSGIYFYKLTVNRSSFLKRMLYLK